MISHAGMHDGFLLRIQAVQLQVDTVKLLAHCSDLTIVFGSSC
jgi:hypothetical protein